MIVTAGSTNVSVYYYIVQDASATSPGEPVTGLLYSNIETGGSASYARQGAIRTDLTLITLASASAAHSDGGFILVDDTNMPGLYRCDYPDAAFATGVDQVLLQIVVASASNAVAAPIMVDIADVDLRDPVRGGMTALPNAAADAAGGLPISDAGGLDLDAMNTNINDIETDTAAMQPLVAKIPLSDGVITWNATALASINAECDTALTDYDAPTNTEMEARTIVSANYATSAAQTTAQNDLDIITGVSGVNLLTATQASIDAIEVDTNSLNDTKVPQTLNLTASGNIGIDWANVENPTTALDLSGTDIQLVDTVTTYTGNTLQTGDSYARLGAPAGASVSADIAAVPTVAEILTTAMTEAYAADGAAPTLTQSLMLIQQVLTDFAISGTTLTARQVDGATAAATFTLSDDTSPTSITRST